MSVYYTVLTDVGIAKMVNATLANQKVDFKEIAVGDGGGNAYNPAQNATSLRNEVWRGNIHLVEQDENNPNWIVIEAAIPAVTGGFHVREIGIYDADGDLVAIGNTPETYKPRLDEGSTKDLYLINILEVSNASAVTLKVDPSAAIANRKYVDDKVRIVSTNLTSLRTDFNNHLAQTSYTQVPTSTDVKTIDYNANLYFRPSATANLPTINAPYYVNVIVNDPIKNTHRKIIARRVATNDLYEMTFADGIWSDWELKLSTSHVIDNLTSDDAKKPVSAKQAKLLKDSLKNAAYQDYEEGTWTPTLIGATSGSASLDIANGQYRRIGKFIIATFVIQKTTAHTLIGDVRIGGLPFASNWFGGSLSIGFRRGIKIDGELVGETASNNYITLIKSADDGEHPALQSSDINSAMRMRGTMTYLID